MKKFHFLRGLLFAAMLPALQGPMLFAQKNQQVSMAGGRKLLLGNIAEAKTSASILQQKTDDVFYFVAHSSQQSMLQQAVQNGQIKLFAKVDDATYLVSSKQTPAPANFSKWGIDAAGALPADLKLSKQLVEGRIPAHAKKSNNQVQLLVGTMPGADARKLLIQAGFQPDISPINQWNVFSITCEQKNIHDIGGITLCSICTNCTSTR